MHSYPEAWLHSSAMFVLLSCKHVFSIRVENVDPDQNLEKTVHWLQKKG